MRLVDLFGEEEVFRFIGYIRDHKGTATAVSEARQLLAANMLQEELRHTGDYEEARRQLAARLGYNETTRTNLYKLITAGEALIAERSTRRS